MNTNRHEWFLKRGCNRLLRGCAKPLHFARSASERAAATLTGRKSVARFLVAAVALLFLLPSAFAQAPRQTVDQLKKLSDVTWDSISDGQLLKRSGDNIIGQTGGGGGVDAFVDLDFTGSNLTSILTRNFSDLQSKPTTLAGYGITDAQPIDADLTAIAALSGTNTIYYRSAANTWTAVTIGGNMTFSGGTLNSTGGGGGGGAWGSITGTLSDQTDLQAALDAKVPTTRTLTIGGTALDLSANRSWLGNVTNDAQTKAAIVPNTAPSSGQIPIGNAGGTAYAKQTLSGSGATATLSDAGVLTLSAIANATLSNSAITIAGTSTSLGGSITQDTITGLSSIGLVKRTGSNALTTITDSSSNWDTAFTDRLKWDGGATGLTAATGRTSLGATTVGGNIFTLTNPDAISFVKIAADNTVSTRTPAQVTGDLSLTIGTNTEAWDADLDTWATLTPTTVGQNLVTLTNPSAIAFLKINVDNTVTARSAANFKADLDLEIGTDLQAWDADLDAWAAVSTGSKANSGANTDITSVLLNQTGLVVKGADANALTIKPNETLTAGRTLNLKVNDAARTIDLSGNLTVSSAATISGTNTGDQTTIVGITGSLSEFNTALTGADFATGGGTVTGTSSGTNTGDQTSIVGITGSLSEFNTALTGADFATLAGSESLTNKKLGSLTSNGFVKTTSGDGTLSVDTSTYLTGNQTITLSGDVTGSGTTAITATLANIPTATTMAGYIATTAIAAPGTPGAGIGRIYVDSTSKNVAVKDDAGVVKHGVQTDTGASNNFLTAISDAGAVTKAQPAQANITGLTTSDSPQFTAVNVGAATDTTIARSGAGAITVEGVQVLLSGAALGTPSSGTLTNCTFPTLNQNTTGSAASLSVSGQTGLVTVTGLASTNRIKTVRDAADTILELGGSYTPTGTWTSLTMVTPVLGTPTSGTLTNCTALPIAGLTASTSTAIGVGSVELGAASDTTVARVGAGQISVEGVNVVTTSSTDTLTNKTVGAGALTLAENASVALDPAGSADGKYSGVTVTGTGGATIAFGDLVTLDKDDSRWELVDISVAAAATGDARGIIGIAVTSSSDGAAITVMLHGIIRADANFPALTIGAAVYASTTGDIVVTQPTTTDHIIRIVGFALTADEIYFCPDNAWITHT